MFRINNKDTRMTTWRRLLSTLNSFYILLWYLHCPQLLTSKWRLTSRHRITQKESIPKTLKKGSQNPEYHLLKLKRQKSREVCWCFSGALIFTLRSWMENCSNAFIPVFAVSLSSCSNMVGKYLLQVTNTPSSYWNQAKLHCTNNKVFL